MRTMYVYPKLIEKTNELVSEGTTEVQEVKRTLKRIMCNLAYVLISNQV